MPCIGVFTLPPVRPQDVRMSQQQLKRDTDEVHRQLSAIASASGVYDPALTPAGAALLAQLQRMQAEMQALRQYVGAVITDTKRGAPLRSLCRMCRCHPYHCCTDCKSCFGTIRPLDVAGQQTRCTCIISSPYGHSPLSAPPFNVNSTLTCYECHASFILPAPLSLSQVR